jgi:DNA-directed RNA polymerase specialized sigma24 family protein
VLHLKAFEGQTFQEIARTTAESINTVASRYRYALEKMKALLGQRK